MTTLARTGFALVLIGAVLLASSTAAVSSIAVERSVEVAVVDDEDASVGFEAEIVDASNETGAGSGEVDVEIEVTNRLDENVTASIEAVDGETVSDGDATTVPPGETGAVTASLECDDEPAAIDVAADGDSVTIERTIEVDPDCSE